MSVKVMGEVFDTDLPKPLKFLLLAMADHADHDGANVRPGVALLALKTSDSERNVRRLIGDLEATGIIKAVAYRRGGHGRATNWRIDLEELHDRLRDDGRGGAPDPAA